MNQIAILVNQTILISSKGDRVQGNVNLMSKTNRIIGYSIGVELAVD